MARRKTHKIALRTLGLTDVEAAQLYYLVTCAAHALTDGPDSYSSASNVPLKTLRQKFPGSDWERVAAGDLTKIVK
jgi:hypothetical protein